MSRSWKWIAAIGVILVVALAAGLVRADFGRTTSADAEPAASPAGGDCPAGYLQLSAPPTVPVNSSVVISAVGQAFSCAYTNVTLVTIALNDTPQTPPAEIDPTGAGSATAYATLNGADYQVGDQVKVGAALTSNSGVPAPVVQTQTVTVVAAESSNPNVTVQLPTQPVVAGQPFTIGGDATNVNPAMYPNGINLNVLLDGTVMATNTLLNQTSGNVTATVPATTAGQHVVEVQLTLSTGPAVASAQQTLTVAAQ